MSADFLGDRYFYSRDIGRIWRVAEALEVGMVCPVVVKIAIPSLRGGGCPGRREHWCHLASYYSVWWCQGEVSRKVWLPAL